MDPSTRRLLSKTNNHCCLFLRQINRLESCKGDINHPVLFKRHSNGGPKCYGLCPSGEGLVFFRLGGYFIGTIDSDSLMLLAFHAVNK